MEANLVVATPKNSEDAILSNVHVGLLFNPTSLIFFNVVQMLFLLSVSITFLYRKLLKKNLLEPAKNHH